MGQIAKPNADVATGSWTPTPVFSQINAPTAGPPDATFVTSGNTNGDIFIVALSGIAYPDPSGGPQTLCVRLRQTATVNQPVTVLLWSGNAIVAFRTIAPAQLSESFQTFTFTLTAGEIGLITSYASLKVQVSVGMPLVTGCGQLAAGAAQAFSFTPSGIANGICQNCGSVNVPTALAYQVNCNWTGPANPCGTPTNGAWGLEYSSQGVLSFFTEAVWTSSGTGWDGRSPLTLALSVVHGPTCGNYPAQITITPIGYTAPNSSSSSSSAGPAAIQVSWVQFQAPVHCAGCPNNPGNPQGGQCACGCGCAQCGGPPPGPLAPDFAAHPIRYATGEIALSATDIHSSGGGFPWGHTRSFASQLTENTNVGNGFNWQVKEWTYLVVQDSGTVVVMGAANSVLWFDPNGTAFTPRFNVRQTLTLDPVNNVYNLYDLDGSVTQYSATSGAFISHSDVAGNTVAVVSYTSNNFNFSEVQRSTTVAGVTTIESFLYDYVDSTAAYPLLSSVTLRRQVNGGSWTNVTAALYTYYSDGDLFGGTGDLQTVVTQTFVGAAWVTTGTTLYRYWLSAPSSSSSSASSGSSGSSGSSSSGSSGSPGISTHLLKYVVLPSSYDRLAAVTNPLTAPDATVALYADLYFQFDSSSRVVAESVNGGDQTFTYSFSLSGNANGYNSWNFKTIETRPDGSQYIVYCNYAGQAMLRVLQSGSSQWCDYYQYDNATADLLVHAHPAGVAGFNESYPDLVNGGTYLNSNTGLFDVYQYHQPTGYLSATLVQQGWSGTPILVDQYQYTACNPCGSSSSSSPSSSSGSSGSSASPCTAPPVYVLAAHIRYPSDGTNCSSSSSSPSSSSGALPQIITSYAYTYWPGTCRVQQRITTKPAISTAQNGSGVSDTLRDYFDIYGNNTWNMNELGVLTNTTYDLPTGAVVQRVADVDTSVVSGAPPGWTTPSFGGLNLVTDITIDSQGRAIQVLGPSHTISIAGTATAIRRAMWTVYQDAIHQVWTAMGYAIGTAPSYTYILINPVSITISDSSGRVLQQIQATRSSTSGALQPTDSFPQLSYTRWTVLQYGSDNLLAAQLTYKLIPVSGSGTVGTNYDQQNFGYDVMDRRNRQVTGGGTITRTVFDVRGNPASAWVGTNDNGATDSDPTGGGAAGNNMVMVTANVYDTGVAGGDGNLTQQTQTVDGSTSRVTNFVYDWRDRQTVIDGEIDFCQKVCYDNLDRVLLADRYNTTTAGNLIARTQTLYDDLDRVYSTIRYSVDPTTGIVGYGLVDNTWFDPVGNVLVQLPAGSICFDKFAYDSLNRRVAQYFGWFDGTIDYAEANSVSADTILTEIDIAYDDASNVIQTTARLRYHNATGLGALGTPSSAQPQARVTYIAQYPDALGRTVAVANYGTNGGSTLSRPDTIPTGTDLILVSSAAFDSAGNVQTTTDPAGTITCFTYDNLGREVQQIMNCQAGSSSSSSGGSSSSAGSSSSGSSGPCPPSLDKNITKLTAYNGDGNVSQITAVNTQTGNQITQYVYGTTLSDSGIASSLLKRYEILPDSVGGSDQLAFTYNCQGEVVTKTDQNGTVHTIDYDLLARPSQDCVTTLGAGVDNAVLRIETDYEVRGMVQFVTNYDNATVGSGNIVNQVQLVYNIFAQLIADYQSHSGAVVIGTTPVCQYGYADGSANTIRQTSMTYPNGRLLTYSYGATGSNEDAASRVASLIDNDGVTSLAEYSYLGRSDIIQQVSPQPGLMYTLIGIDGGNDPVTGDIYRGLDSFSRMKDLIWLGTGAGSSSSSSGPANILERIQHGYDQANNRLYRAEPVDPNDQHDEFYDYDGVYRLKDFQRGSLNATDTGITSLTFAQCWNLDEAGNWSGFREDDTGDGLWDLMQNRASNPANEISVVTESVGPSWVTPGYDKAGNMTTMPQPASPTQSFGGTYDAWNRLVKLTETGVTVATYSHDGLNRRAVVSTYSGGSLAETRHLFFSYQWQVVEERVGSASTPERQMVWGLKFFDDLVLRDRDVANTGSLTERLYAIQDDNANVTALVALSGVVVERYCYSGYGIVSVLAGDYSARVGTAYSWHYLFACYHQDIISSLYYVRFRQYHSPLGLFIQRDPAGMLAGEINLYRYVMNSPLNHVDPSGLQHDLLLQDHHWFPQMGRGAARRGQAAIDRLCNGIIDIDDYTTTYQAEGHFLTFPWYTPLVAEIYDSSSNCCAALLKVTALMFVTHTLISRIFPDTPPFSLHVWRHRDRDTTAQYFGILAATCAAEYGEGAAAVALIAATVLAAKQLFQQVAQQGVQRNPQPGVSILTRLWQGVQLVGDGVLAPMLLIVPAAQFELMIPGNNCRA